MDEDGLSDEWRRWVADALERGVETPAIAAALMAEQVPETIAVREIGIIAAACGPLAARNRRMQLVLDVLREHAPGYLARRPRCGAEEFYDRYFSASRPVVFADGCADMAARGWTFASLRERFGDREIDVGLPVPRRMRLAEALDAMLLPDAPPDLYIQSHNRALSGPLRELAAELHPLPDFLDAAGARDSANLWLGPAGTLSPLHHDTTHVYFCQLAGRKRYQLIAPWEVDVLCAPMRDSDSSYDPDSDGRARVLRVDLEPGESLFIPVGWWHQVLALEPSISVSLRAFPWSAGCPWYLPGQAVTA
jgi:hypothetical protein